jgi:hypothetical protein
MQVATPNFRGRGSRTADGTFFEHVGAVEKLQVFLNRG